MKNFKRILSVVLCVCLLASCAVCFASAEETATGTAPTRLSVTVNGDTASSRGFCWYTAEQTDTKIEIQDVDASEYSVE
ncbi:MAG: hypothetical protein IIW48_02480, partial [Clostridia bacterium]|nr:hypothetical protein [Clostridia bacterium]